MNWKTAIVIVAAALLISRSARKKRIMLGKNFSLDEFTRSKIANQQGISNNPGPIEIANLQALVTNVLQPLRDALKVPINVTSGYRSLMLNNAIGGAANSQHMQGQAADIVSNDNARMFNYIKNNLPYDQLIWEAGNDSQPDWVHVSFRMSGNRYKIFKVLSRTRISRHLIILAAWQQKKLH
jgi:zinc D-Ala-D-Ala carboxypeptidase